MSDFAQLSKMTETHQCTCGGRLTVGWDGSDYVLRCGRDKAHTGFVKHGDPVIERFEAKRGGTIPDEQIDSEIEQYLAKEGSKHMVEMVGTKRVMALEKYQGMTSLTPIQARDILVTLWPDAPEIELHKAELTCVIYGLNPLAKHLYLIPFKNKNGVKTWAQVLGIGATRLVAARVARKWGGYSYVDGPRVMTEAEQVKVFGKADAENVKAITMLKDGRGNQAPGYGSWPKGEMPYGSDKGNSAENMAFIRSERAAFNRLFPLQMPETEEVMDERYLVSIDQEYSEGGGRPELGVATEEVESPLTEGSEDVVEVFPEEAEAQDTEKKNWMPEFHNWGDVAKAAHDLGIGSEEVFKAARVKKWQDFSDYRDAWNWVQSILADRQQKPKML